MNFHHKKKNYLKKKKNYIKINYICIIIYIINKK